MLAELAIGRPWPTGLGGLERQRVDVDRTTPEPLDVVGAGVTQREAVLDRGRLDVEGQQCGFVQLTEGPLVGIADELERLGSDDAVRPIPMRELDRRRLILEDQAPRLQRRSQRARFEGLPLRGEPLLDLAVGPTLMPEDESAGVAKRSWIAPIGAGAFDRGQGSARGVAVLRVRVRRIARAPVAKRPRESCEVRAEEEWDRHQGGDDGLDDQASRAGVDIGEVEVHERSFLSAAVGRG
jgi:hypothetical protein